MNYKQPVKSIFDLMAERHVINVLLYLDVRYSRAVPFINVYKQVSTNPNMSEKMQMMADFDLVVITLPSQDRDCEKYPSPNSKYIQITEKGRRIATELWRIAQINEEETE